MFSKIISIADRRSDGRRVGAVSSSARLRPGDAFFIAAAIVIVFTGQQLHRARADGLCATPRRRSSRSRRRFAAASSFAAYFACLALGALVTAQVFLGA